MKIILLVKDLVSRTHIKSSLPAEGYEISGPRDFSTDNLPPAENCRIFLDLETASEFLPALVKLPADYKSKSIYCFFPHIKIELAEAAQLAGLTNIMPRSKFFNSISTLL